MTNKTKDNKDYKTVVVSPETHKRLEGLGRKGESYDTIIVRLLDYFQLNNKTRE